MKRAKHILLSCLLLIVSATGFAQLDLLNKAQNLYVQKKLDSARIVINRTLKNPETAKNYQTWMLRGVIYKELYKLKETDNVASPSRDSAVVSLIQCIEIDAKNENPQKQNIIKSLSWLAAQYHNDILKITDTLHYEQALVNAKKYKAIKKVVEPTFNEKEYDYKIYSSIGSMFEECYNKNSSKKLLDLAKAYLLKAYDIDNNSDLVNKNLGVLYYNQAVDIIKKMDYDIPLDQLPIYQDNSIKLGKQALPYLLKAIKANTSDKAVLEGLAGVYYLLNETEKYNEYKRKSDEIK
ncbi:MAG: hypothetical protein JST67_02515 [Bacteroidetes bacterium]|nr:hypothetical protein [Bacteroidota bacterium]